MNRLFACVIVAVILVLAPCFLMRTVSQILSGCKGFSDAGKFFLEG